MSALSELKRAGGSAGGVAIYSAAKVAAELSNVQRKDRKLWKTTRAEMRKYFPKLDLTKVTFHINSTLPGNWFQTAGSVEAMTFGYTIFFKHSDYQKSRKGLKYLMHELVHVDQVRRKGGEIAFAQAYGRGFLAAGNYRDNPLEVEAYEFVEKNGDALPNGVKKQ